MIDRPKAAAKLNWSSLRVTARQSERLAGNEIDDKPREPAVTFTMRWA